MKIIDIQCFLSSVFFFFFLVLLSPLQALCFCPSSLIVQTSSVFLFNPKVIYIYIHNTYIYIYI